MEILHHLDKAKMQMEFERAQIVVLEAERAKDFLVGVDGSLKCICFSWSGKKDVAEYVSRCLTCQQVKASRQKRVGLL